MEPIIIQLGPGAKLHLEGDLAKRVWSTLATEFGSTTEPARAGSAAGPMLETRHAMWETATGAGDEDAPGWTDADEDRAVAFYAALHGKGKKFFDVLLESPGRLVEVSDFDRAFPGDFPNAYAVAGAINGLRRPCKTAGRRYPFSYWQTEGSPTRYAIHPDVAALFIAAREALS